MILDAVQKAPEKSFIKFKNGLISLLQSKVSKKVSLETLEHEYNSFHGSCPLMKNLGFDNPNDLFDAMKPEIEVNFLWLFLLTFSSYSTFAALKVNSHWRWHDTSRHDADQIWFVGISAMRTHRVFSWMRHSVSEMKNSIFDTTLCFRTTGKVSEVG